MDPDLVNAWINSPTETGIRTSPMPEERNPARRQMADPKSVYVLFIIKYTKKPSTYARIRPPGWFQR